MLALVPRFKNEASALNKPRSSGLERVLQSGFDGVRHGDVHRAIASREVVRHLRDGKSGVVFGRWIRSGVEDARANGCGKWDEKQLARVGRYRREKDRVRGERRRESASADAYGAASVGVRNRTADEAHDDEPRIDPEADTWRGNKRDRHGEQREDLSRSQRDIGVLQTESSLQSAGECRSDRRTCRAASERVAGDRNVAADIRRSAERYVLFKLAVANEFIPVHFKLSFDDF